MLSQQGIEILKKSALNVRRNIVKMIHAAKSGHPGGSLSGADILTVLYKKSLNIKHKAATIIAIGKRITTDFSLSLNIKYNIT